MRLPAAFSIHGLWRCSFFGQFSTLTDFPADNVQLEYTVQLPDHWFHRSPDSALSHKCFVSEQQVAHINLPFSINVFVPDECRDETKKQMSQSDDHQEEKDDGKSSEQEETGATDGADVESVVGISWPRVCVRVFGMQTLAQRVLLGTGSASLPHEPGHHVLTIPTFAPAFRTHAHRLSHLFLGFAAEKEETEERGVESQQEERETSGRVRLEVQCVARSEASVERRARQRQLLSASIEQVVAAFERAKLEMMDLRSRVMLNQQDYNNVTIQRTCL